MSKDERDFLEKLRATSIEAAAEIMEGLQRLRSFNDELLDDGSGAVPKPRLGDHFYQLAKLELEHAASVMRLGSVQAEMLFSHVRQLARGARGGQAPMLVLELDAPKNESNGHRGTFTVRNPFDQRADVRFEFSSLHGSDGKEIARPDTLSAASRPNPIHAHGTGEIEVVFSGNANALLFGTVDVFLSANVERCVARRALKVRPGG